MPFGKRYKIVLSDGTLVHLNSGSKLKYPVKFDKKKPRGSFLKVRHFLMLLNEKTKFFLTTLMQLMSKFTEQNSISRITPKIIFLM